MAPTSPSFICSAPEVAKNAAIFKERLKSSMPVGKP